MNRKVGQHGQIVIPKAIRDQAQLLPGDEVDVYLEDGHIVIAARRPPARLGGKYARSGMAARLLEDRSREQL